MVTLDIGQLRTDLRRNLGVISTDEGFDDDGCDLLLNQSLWHLLNVYPFREKERSTTYELTVGLRSYSLPTLFDAVQLVSIQDMFSDAHTKLERMTREVYESEYVNNADAYGKPEKYYREGACIVYWPTPDDTYTITLKYLITLSDLEDANPDFPLPNNWYEILLLGAQWRGHLALKQWSELTNCKNLQASIINDVVPVEAKEEKDSRRAGFSVPDYNPEDIYS